MSNSSHQQVADEGAQSGEPPVREGAAQPSSGTARPDAADTGLAAPSGDCASALERIERGLAALMERLADPPAAHNSRASRQGAGTQAGSDRHSLSSGDTETRLRSHAGNGALVDDVELPGPSLEEAWDQEAADALAELYASGGAGLASRLGDDAALQARLAGIARPRESHRPAISAAQEPGQDGRFGAPIQDAEGTLQHGPNATPGASLEVRLSGFERRLDTALAEIAARPDAAALQTIGGQVIDLLAHVGEVRAGLDRIDLLERRLADLNSALSPDQISRLFAAAAPSAQELERIAETAAAKALEQHGGGGLAQTTDRPTDGSMGIHIDELRELLTSFIDERRRSEHQIADVLDTMQQAMEHIHDRIDAMVGLTNAPPSDTPATPAPSDAQTGSAAGEAGEPFADQLASSAHSAAATASARAAGSGTNAAAGPEADMLDDLTAFDPFHSGGPPPLQSRNTGSTGPQPATDAQPPEARRRARGVPGLSRLSQPATLLAISLIAFTLAGFWLIAGARLETVGEQQAGVPGDPAATSEAHTTAGAPARSSSAETDAPLRALQTTGEQGADHASSARSDGATVDDDAVAPVLQGITVEQGERELSPVEMMRVRQKQRMAQLSSRTGRQAAEAFSRRVEVAPQAMVTGTTGEAHGEENVLLEMPPLTIGPNSLRLAAAHGDASAQFEVAARFAEGKGVKQDFAQAATWYQRAAAQGLATAQYRLGTLYERGMGVKLDKAQARIWYQRSAEQGNVKAMHNLAVLSAGGDSQDYQTAARWFGRAAEHGLADSQYNLGVLHENGLGVPKSLATAYKWYSLAAMNGDKEARRRRDLVAPNLSAGVRRSVDHQVERWQPKPVDRLTNDALAAGQAWRSNRSEASG